MFLRFWEIQEILTPKDVFINFSYKSTQISSNFGFDFEHIRGEIRAFERFSNIISNINI